MSAKKSKNSQVFASLSTNKPVSGTEQLESKGKKTRLYAVIFLGCLLAGFFFFALIALLLPAGDKQVPGHKHDALPPVLENLLDDVVSSGDNLLLLTGYDRTLDSVSLDYRKVNDLEKFVTAADLPIVILIREQGRNGSEVINPYVEDLAEKWRGQLYVLLVEPDQKSDFLDSLDFRYLPTFYLLIDKKPVLEVNGYRDEDLAAFSQALEETLRGGTIATQSSIPIVSTAGNGAGL